MMMVLMVLMNDDGKGDVVRSGNCFPMRRMEGDTYTTCTPCVRSSRYMIRFRDLLFQVRGQARLYRAAWLFNCPNLFALTLTLLN